jgi:hypothetical protein
MTPTIDEALELLEHTGPEFGGGLSNHGPMAAEALFRLGRAEAAVPWVERYRRRLQDEPAAMAQIDATAWRESLGKIEMVGPWTAFFEQQLSESPWPEVLFRWAPALAPGLVAAATHGVIRTAHAVRSLEGRETPLRVKELARGLAYWAARYQELPWQPAPPGSLLPSAALGRLHELPEGRQRRMGLITTGLSALKEDEAFPEVANLVTTNVGPSAFLSDLTAAFAGVYLRKASDTGLVITFIHAVTGPSAVRLLLPYVSGDQVAPLLRYAWQAAAALYVAYGCERAVEQSTPDIAIDDLIDEAVATGDEHAIKFTEACLREHELNPQPVFLAAAAHATSILRRG